MIVAFKKFVCKLYKCKSVEVNKVHHELFQKKYIRENKIIDLALLQPCHSSLMFPLSRCNYVACLWKASALANFEISAHGWTSECEIQRLDEIFWADYEELSTYGNDNKNKNDIDGNYDEDSKDDF